MRAEDVRAYALSLPSVIEAPHHEATSFRVDGKIFATLPPDGACVHIFVGEEERETAIALGPDAFEKLFWGEKVAGLKVKLGKARLSAVQALLRNAWVQKAPKKLLAAHSADVERR